MSDHTTSEPLDLDVDLRAVDTSMPVLKTGLYEMLITDITREQNKEQTGYNLVVTFATANEETTTTDRKVPAGKLKIKQWMPLQSKDGTDDWQRNLAALQEAALGEKQARFNTADLLNRKVVASVKEDVYQDQPTNKIGRLTAPQ